MIWLTYRNLIACKKPDLKFADTQFFNWILPRDTKVHVSYLISMVINCTACLKGPSAASPHTWLGLLSSHLLTSFCFHGSFVLSPSPQLSPLDSLVPPSCLSPLCPLPLSSHPVPSLLSSPLPSLSLCCFSDMSDQGIP